MQVGKVYVACRVDGEAWVSPTRLALALSGGPSTEAQKEVAEGYVIVETNYRVSCCSSAGLTLYVPQESQRRPQVAARHLAEGLLCWHHL